MFLYNILLINVFFLVQVQPTLDDGAPWEQYPLSDFVRTGLLGFLGPVRISLSLFFFFYSFLVFGPAVFDTTTGLYLWVLLLLCGHIYMYEACINKFIALVGVKFHQSL